MTFGTISRLLILSLAIIFSGSFALAQNQKFVVEDIRLEGLGRVEPANILANLNFAKGAEIDNEVISASIVRLYSTGLFRDIEIEREGDVLVITVVENPIISRLTFVGLRSIDETDIIEFLNLQGIGAGRILRRGIEKDAERIVASSYQETARYLSNVRVTTVPQDGNTVELLFTVNEGAEARINSIRIFGATAFDEGVLLKQLQMKTSGLLNTYFGNDIYTTTALEGDLERISSYYLDRGFVRFEIVSTDLQLNFDDFTIAIEIHVNEGARYYYGDTNLSGGHPFTAEELEQMQPYTQDQVFSDTEVERFGYAIRDGLRDRGYAYANVTSEQLIDDDNQEIDITYKINLEKLVEVRRIVFVGNNETADNVLRRQLSLFEGEIFSRQKLEESLNRLRRTGYLVSVNADEIPVNEDEIDVEINVVEESLSKLTFGLSYSKSSGVSYFSTFSRKNILGSGNDFSFSFDRKSKNNSFAFNFKEAYFTDSGINRSYSLFWDGQRPNKDDSTIVHALLRRGGSLNYDIPVDEKWSWSFGARYEQIKLTNPTNLRNDANSLRNGARAFLDKYGDSTNVFRLNLGLNYDTRDSAFNPTLGANNKLTANLGIPLGKVKYYQLHYDADAFANLTEDLRLEFSTKLRYGDKFGDGIYPFYERYFFSTDDLRGFEANKIGPQNAAKTKSLGGRLLWAGRAEVIRDIDLFGVDSAQIGAFLDAGGLWDSPSDLDADDLRASGGVLLKVRTPVAPLSFSYGFPIKKKTGDRLERFQFKLSF